MPPALKLLNFEGNMKMFEVSVGLLCLAFLLVVIALIVYFKADDTYGHQSLEKLNKYIADQKEKDKSLDTLLLSNAGNSNAIEHISKETEKKLKEMYERIEKQDDRLDVFEAQCADTREKQIQLRDDLSKKRPVVQMKGVLPVEIYMNNTPEDAKRKSGLGKGVKSLFKEEARK